MPVKVRPHNTVQNFEITVGTLCKILLYTYLRHSITQVRFNRYTASHISEDNEHILTRRHHTSEIKEMQIECTLSHNEK